MFSIFNTFESFLIGICVGSFINVIVFRLPNNLSIVTPRSFCPRCKKKISWKENIPLFSWLVQKGRCISCNTKISIRYPLIEFSTGLLFILFINSEPYLYNSNFINSNIVIYFENIFSWVFLCVLFVISLIDFKHFWVPQSFINLGFFFNL